MPAEGRPAWRRQGDQLINLRVFSADICVSFFPLEIYAPEEQYVNREKQMKTDDVLQRSTIRKLNTLPPRRTFKKINSSAAADEKKKLTLAKPPRRKGSAFGRQINCRLVNISRTIAGT